MANLLESYYIILKAIARMSGGYATITSKDGLRIKTFNSEGQEVEEMEGVLYPLAQKAAETGEIQLGSSQILDGAEAWAIPVNDYVLAASNFERYTRDKQLFNSMMEALPLIARVAGGEAVLFDKEGKRLACVLPNGTSNERFLGTISKAAKQAMTLHKAIIGESNSVNGASAVRIPITEEFGFGFNDELRVQKEHKLLEEVKKYQYARHSFEEIVGESEAIKKTKSIAAFIANGVSSVIIFGETGTGKELFAQAIHNASPRRSKPFVAINCGALPASIIESYLFGYEGGSFTGAKKEGNPGSFEQADGGTIFLDEISEMDYNLQSKLLRVLQEREITRIGGSKPKQIDTRVIASTNKNLQELIKKGSFREDLYYRLNVVEIRIPPLRERKEDIPILANVFIKKFNNMLGKFILAISNEVIERLISHNWPGNIRELQNCIEHAINMVSINENTIKVEHLPTYLQEVAHNKLNRDNYYPTLEQQINDFERGVILKALQTAKQSKKEAAKLLGISTITLWRKINQFGI